MSVIETIGLHWRDLSSRFLDLLFPPRCVGCRRMGSILCTECLQQIPPVEPSACIRCGDKAVADGLCQRCRTSPLKIERIRSVVYFQDVLRKAIHLLKYRGRAALARSLGQLMAEYWTQHPILADVIVPVPLHVDRLRERGYNQAALLAREMGSRLEMMVDEKTLVRRRATAPQTKLDAAQRKDNVRDAFYCSSDALAGKHVLLVDDVCTTGATLEACAIALCESGARSVEALTLARAR